MSLRIYSLTPIGHQLSHSTSAPNNENYRVIFWLSKSGRGTPESISQNTGLSVGEVARALRRLKFSGVVQEDNAVTA